MIFREVDGKLYGISDVSPEDELRFMEKNPTGGFIRVDAVPFAQYGNYKLVDGEVVVDEEAEANRALLQYRLDRTYPEINEQLDAIYRDIANNKLDQTGDFFNMIKTVKDYCPKTK